MKKLRVGMAGFGLSGAVFHAPLIEAHDGFELTAVMTSRETNVREKHPQAKVVGNIEALVGLPDVDLVLVCVPNHLHYPFAKMALEAGKHVVLEKPFVPEVQMGEELVALAQERQLTLTVFHNRRWDNDLLTLKKLIAEGLLGDVMHYEVHFDRYRPSVDGRWKELDYPGGGNLFDLGSHLIDQALHLFGQPDTVYADVTTQRADATNPDYFHVILQYGKMRAILHGGTLVVHPGPRMHVHGSLGSFVKSGIDPQEDALKRGMKPGQPGWGEESHQFYGRLYFPQNSATSSRIVPSVRGSYESFYDGVYHAIAHGGEPPVTAKDALDVVRIIKLAEESSRSGRVIPV